MDAPGPAPDYQAIYRREGAGGVRARGAALCADRQAGRAVRRSASAGERRAGGPDAGKRHGHAGAAAAVAVRRTAFESAHAAAEDRRAQLGAVGGKRKKCAPCLIAASFQNEAESVTITPERGLAL